MKTLKFYFLSICQLHSIINYSHQVISYILRPYSSYNQKFCIFSPACPYFFHPHSSFQSPFYSLWGNSMLSFIVFAFLPGSYGMLFLSLHAFIYGLQLPMSTGTDEQGKQTGKVGSSGCRLCGKPGTSCPKKLLLISSSPRLRCKNEF